MNSIRIGAYKYNKKFVTRVTCIKLAHGVFMAGLFLAGNGVPAAHASTLLGLTR
jgi:hypothetical protein